MAKNKKRNAINISLGNDDNEAEALKQRLEDLAVEFGATWGDSPNISGLIKAIADGSITLHKPGDSIDASDRTYYRAQLESISASLKNLEKLVD